MALLLDIQDLWIQGQSADGTWSPIIRGASLQMQPGEVVALIGESGAGKSTLGLAALGYTRPGCRFSSGSVKLNGQDLVDLSTADRQAVRGKDVAYVAQSAAAGFNPALAINHQVTEGPVFHKIKSRSDAIADAQVLYRELALPDPDNIGERYPHQVSGGQLQRLMTAMAMSCHPGLLILDEPTTALDVTTQIEVLQAIKKAIQQSSTAAIYVTHDLSVVAQVADRSVVMRYGEIVEEGPTSELIREPKAEYSRTLIGAVKSSPRQVVEKSQEAGGQPARQPDEVIVLETRNVDTAYGETKILHNVNLSLAKGQTLAVVGESGCGKSTMARVMSGLKAATAGEVALNGEVLNPAVRGRSREEIRKIQMIFQIPDVSLNPRHTISEILGRPLTFYHGLKGAKREARVNELLEMVELPVEFATRRPAELSGGQKQRIGIARALAADPEVILCDEVTSALDTVVGAAVIELLRDLQEKLGVAYVFISHDLAVVADVASDIAVFYAGRVVEHGPRDAVFSPPFHPYTQVLLSSVPELRPGWLEEVTEGHDPNIGMDGTLDLNTPGCPFADRCPVVIDGTCQTQKPPIRELVAGNRIACHRAEHELA